MQRWPTGPEPSRALALRCGEREVNILGLQIFPGLAGVTDELVLRTPRGWTLAAVAALVESAGGLQVGVGACTEHALVDGPTRYLTALRQVVHGMDTPSTVLARLLDADTEEPAGAGRSTAVQTASSWVPDPIGWSSAVRRRSPRRSTPGRPPSPRPSRSCVSAAWPPVRSLRRLLGAAARLAAERDVADVVLRGPAESPAAVAMVFASELCARLRLAGDELLVTVSTRGPAPRRSAVPVGLPPTPAPSSASAPAPA